MIKQELDTDGYCFSYDLGLSATLVSTGCELVALDKTNPHKVQFIFKKTVDIDKKIEDYWSNNLLIPARSLFDNAKMLKNRIYSE